MTCSFPDQGDCTCHGQDLVADRMRAERDELRAMLKRLLDVALVDGYGETVAIEARALLEMAA